MSRGYAFADFGSILHPRCRFCYAEVKGVCSNCGHTLKSGKCVCAKKRKQAFQKVGV